MKIINGVELLDYSVHADHRGQLAAFEQDDALPFRLKRVFFIKVDTPNGTRGGHANSCDEYIVALSGSVEIETDNGAERARVALDERGSALWVRPGIVIRLRNFDPGTLLLVCASASYGETRHFDRPQPHLIGTDCFA